MGFVGIVGDVSEQCQICIARDKAPPFPIAGASKASAFNGHLKADWHPPGDAIALCAANFLSKFSLLLPARPKNRQDVWGGSCSATYNFRQTEVHPADKGGYTGK